MSLFRRIFGGSGDPLTPLRHAVKQRRWAEALAIGEEIDRAILAAAAAAELDELLATAGDALAELNLAEAEAFLRAGDAQKAAEHLSLAFAQARSAALQERIARLMPDPSPRTAESNQASACGASCASDCHAGPAGVAAEPLAPGEFDNRTRMELILASYPQQLAGRYASIGELFCEAFLLAHEGDDREALECFSRVPQAEHDELFFFERGSLLIRLGETAAARADLQTALSLNADFVLAAETLVQLELAAGEEAKAEERVRQMQSRGMSPAFCHGVLASLRVGQGRLEEALAHGFAALEAGGSGDHVLLTASLLERAGRLDEAEALLLRLPPAAGGCAGGGGLALAEFWLRRGKNLDKALEAFKAALRYEPDSPRWVLRVAQVYIGLGWRKEGMALLDRALADSRLDPGLYAEGVALRAGQ